MAAEVRRVMHPLERERWRVLSRGLAKASKERRLVSDASLCLCVWLIAGLLCSCVDVDVASFWHCVDVFKVLLFLF